MNLKELSFLTFDDKSNILKDRDNNLNMYYTIYGSNPSVGGGEAYLQNSCLVFNLYLQHSIPLLQKEFTIDYKMKVISSAGYGIINCFAYGSTNFKQSDGYMYSNNGFNVIRNIPNTVTNVYRRYTFTLKNNFYRYFIDGVLYATHSYSASNIGFYVLANDPWGGGNYGHGYVKEMGIYANAVTEEFDPSIKFVRDYYSLDEKDNEVYGLRT